MSLNPCKVCGAPAVEHIRGKMGPGDHIGQREDYHLHADVGEEHANDFRVHCSKCQNSTGWDRSDIERFENRGPGDNRRVCVTRDGNLDAIRARWNDANPVK